jgi:hypothetical protein
VEAQDASIIPSQVAYAESARDAVGLSRISIRTSGTFIVFIAAAVTASLLAFAVPASADRSAKETIDALERNGYKVRPVRAGTGPLDKCVVTKQAPGEDVTKFVNGERTLIYKVMLVTVDCTAHRKSN